MPKYHPTPDWLSAKKPRSEAMMADQIRLVSSYDKLHASPQSPIGISA